MNRNIISQHRAVAFDYLYDAVVVTDLEGVIIDWNTGSQQLYGYTKQEAIGQSVSILHVPDDLDHVTRDVLDGIARDGKWTGEVRMLRKDRTMGWIESMCVPLFDENKQAIGALGINRDITKRVEREKQMLGQSRLAQMGEMISMIAHQWRQPLSSITTLTTDASIRLVTKALSFENKSEYKKSEAYLLDIFKRIENLSLHLSDTINGFREFFKPNKEVSTFLFSSMLDKALDLLEGSLNTKEIRIEKEYADNIEVTNYEFELVQVVLNILKNAIDVMDEFKVKNPKISLVCSHNEEVLTLVLSNNGPAIEEKYLDKIFEPYFSTKEHNGTGLGLYISKIIIEEHCKGQLSVKNTTHGVSFVIKLPLEV